MFQRYRNRYQHFMSKFICHDFLGNLTGTQIKTFKSSAKYNNIIFDLFYPIVKSIFTTQHITQPFIKNINTVSLVNYLSIGRRLKTNGSWDKY